MKYMNYKVFKTMSNDKKILLWCFFSTFLFGLAAHAFMFFNPSYSHDSLLIIQDNDDRWKISLGRFMQPLWRQLRGYCLSTWLIGLLSIFFIALSVFFIIKILSIKAKTSISLIAGILVTNTSITLTYATYMHEGDMFALALLFGILSVYIILNYRYGFLWGAVFFAISIGFYQAYITMPIGLIMILIIKNMLENKSYKEICNKILKSLIMCFLGSVIYFVVMKLTLRTFNINASSTSNSVNGIKELSLNLLPKLIIDAYTVLINEIFNFSIENRFLAIIVVVMVIIISLYYLLKQIRHNRLSTMKIIFLLILVILLPLGFNCIVILSPNIVHSLMMYGCFQIFVFSVALFDWSYVGKEDCEKNNRQIKIEKLGRFVIIFFLGIMIFHNIVFSNAIYTKKYVQAQATLSTMTRVVNSIEEVDGFNADKNPIVFVGSLNDSGRVDFTKFYKYSGAGVSNGLLVTYEDTYYSYLSYIMGYPHITVYNLPQATSKEKILQNAEVIMMPSFPKDGYCKIVEGCMVVKLS